MLDHGSLARRGQPQETRTAMALATASSGQMKRSSRLCYRYRRAVYVATFIIVVQLVAAWTFFFVLEKDEEGRRRREEMVWSADRELGRVGGETKGAGSRDVNPKLSGVHGVLQKQPKEKIQFASVKNNSLYTKMKGNKIPSDRDSENTMLHPQVTVANALSLGIFKEVMHQFKDSPINLPGNQNKQIAKEEVFPLDRRRTGEKVQSLKEAGTKMEAEKPIPEQVNSNQLTNSANANSLNKAAILMVPPAYDNDPPDEAPPAEEASPIKEAPPGKEGKLKKQYQSRVANMTVGGNKTIYLEYLSKCHVEGKDAVSALARATSLQCKQEIADTFCDMKKGSLYPQKMTRMCPLKGKPSNEVQDNPKLKIEDGRPVRIVYVLVVHGRALRQVRRLIRLLFHTNHYFYIHVDSRSNYLHRELAKIAQRFRNIRLTSWQLPTIWGGASLLQVYLRCIEDLLNMEDWEWDFFINLSESDMPIRTNDHLVRFLTRYRKYNFLKAHGNDDERKDKNGKKKPGFIKKQGLDKVFYECDTHMWRLGDRKLPAGIILDGGSDWITINRQFAEYLIMSNSELLAGLKQLYKYTLLPAESFFHTVLENSELCKTFVDNNLRVTNWKRKLGCQCQYKHIVDWCGCSPNDFKPEDMYKTKPNRPAYFARKFEPVINQAVINQLDSFLYGAYPLGTPGDRTYWQSLYHHEDGGTEAAGDVVLTVYQSFVRQMAAHINLVSQGQPFSHHCAYSIKSSPTEVTMFFQNDDFRGVIVSVEGQTPKGTTDVLEVWLSLAREYRILSYVGPSTRLQKFQVGTQYDLKERVLRNFANIMGPEDSPVVFIKWKPGEQVQVTISWIDPTNHIAGSFDTTVDHDKEETHHSPPFKKPLRPGKWYVKLLYQWMVVAEVEFLIVPQALAEGRPIQRYDSTLLNSGVPNDSYVEKDFSSMKPIFQLADSATLVEEANKRARNDGEALHDWVDEILGQHWSVMGFCVAPTNGSKLAECRQFKPCYSQSWSTLSPDPKSDLSYIKADGRIR
ncbi:xylosyltransferase 1-like isoform X2 [Acanthaster planci]|uniref:protein xylosyltransferase n=1 Tax=Acanthaster planci TaxID=133434 RepID=A0A8B7YLY4_ACAPL|nr:xylosyltransferase 1-like isoform X2 [Acanthaster planci]